MKRCPECRRDYYDETLLYCLDDGNELLDGPASSESRPRATEELSSSESPTAVFRVSPSGGSVLDEGTRAFTNNPHDTGDSVSNSIAVLPFKNISADPDNEYFCEGLAEELLNALAKIRELKVAARTSAFSFKNGNADIGEIGRRLGVAHVVEGSVRKSGDRLRVAVQLLNASDGYHIWSETYDREMRDLFDVQDEITLAVIDALKLKILGGAKSTVLRRETENHEAYKAYLRGRHLRYAKNDHNRATLAYEEAVRLDPLHAPSWVALAESYVLRAHYAALDPREACAKTREALAKAREIQGESAEQFYVEGFAAFIERDWKGCDSAYRRSIEMDPHNSRALGTFGVINCVLGNVEEGLAVLERAREADPLAAYPYAMTGCGLAAAGRPEDALPYLEQAFAFESENTLAQWTYCIAAVAVGKYDEGIAIAQKAAAASGRAGFFLGLLGWALGTAGREEEAKGVLEELRDRPADSPLAPPEACLLAALEEKVAAIDLIERAMDELAPMAYYVGLPCFDRLREDPRYRDLLKRIDHPRSNL